MIGERQQAEILRLYHVEAWPVATIAGELSLHHSVIERVLAQEGQPRLSQERASILDAYLPFVRQTLEQHPRLRASRLYDMCVARGYQGGPDHFRHRLRALRPARVAEAYLRLATLPGQEAQVDWAHFGRMVIGRASRPLIAFAMILSWSRMLFVRFFLSAKMDCFLRGHVLAMEAFGGSARVLLYDNLKSAVCERKGDAIRFHPTLLALAARYRFEPRPVAVARGNEKGRIERAIRFVRDSFFAARRWRDLDDLNAQVHEWCRTRAAQRSWPDDRQRTVAEVFEEERPRLLPLPDDAFPGERLEEVSIGKTPYARFDGNDYSVPHTLVRRVVSLVASETRVRVLDSGTLVAEHLRSWDKGQRIEDSAHVEALVAEKRKARKGRASDRLSRAAPTTDKLLEELGRRGENLGSACGQLLRLLERYGARRLERAAREALSRGTPQARSVHFILERERIEEGTPGRMPVDLPDDPRVRDIVVRPHSLESYGALIGDEVSEAGEQSAEEDRHGEGQ